MRRVVTVLIAFTTLLLSAVSAHAALPAGEIHLGAVFSQSGAAAAYGAHQAPAAQLAVEEVNASGTLGAARLVLDVRDDASTAAGATAAFTQLIDGGAVALLGPTLSGAALEADQVAQARGVPVLAVSNTGDGVVEIGDFIFRDSLSERVVQPTTVRVSHRRLRYRRAAIVWATPDAYSKSAHDVFAQTLRDTRGARLVADISFASDSRNGYRAALRKVARKRPDALFIAALAPDVVKVMKAARRMPRLHRVPFIGGNSFNAPGLLAQAGTAAEGAISGSAWIASEDTPGNRAFVAAYRARFGSEPDQFAAQSYTGVKLLAMALANAGTTDRTAVRDALGALRDVDTVLGRFSFDAEREPVHDPVVQQVRHGRFVKIGS
jgi:branched-chain amino acid transport system substrate-binding protein